jgi:hypothetical protein
MAHDTIRDGGIMRKLLFSLVLVCCFFTTSYAIGTSSILTIWTLSVTKLPMLDKNGRNWDEFSGPDVYFVIYDELGNVLFRSKTIIDVHKEYFPLKWKFNNELKLDKNRQYKIAFFDEDITKSDKMDETDLYQIEPISWEFENSTNTILYNQIIITGTQNAESSE